jgi:alginate O-acetyltransferase complex protein AlgI
MLFTTIDFIIFFIVVLTFIAFIKNRKFQHLFLLSASYFFFYYTSNYLILLLIFSTILDFYLGKWIYATKHLRKKKSLLIISLATNLGLLGFFKYADFVVLQFNILGNYVNLSNEIPLLNLALPIGISFYTFQTISYTVDIYRGQLIPCKSIKQFALFVAFFPQLVAGPIIRAKDFLPQLLEKFEQQKTGQRLRQILFQEKNVKLGITIMSMGFFKKLFFADNMSFFVNQVFQDPIGLESFTIILATIAFGVQIYADFSGYTDIAIGAALLLGFKIPANFKKPYFAISPSDFWKRWHISLSAWLRDYFYIPLGGNKKGKDRIYLNLIVVMVFGGLWHGASFNFIIWGTLHGLYLIVHKIIKNRFPSLQNSSFLNSTKGKIISIFITQYFVFLAWIPFRVHDVDNIIYSMQKFILIDFEFTDTVNFLWYGHKSTMFILTLFFILHYISYRHGNLIGQLANLKIFYWALFLTCIFSIILFFGIGSSNDFIYFQF